MTTSTEELAQKAEQALSLIRNHPDGIVQSELWKELGIDSTYLFTMHVNLDEDICNSVSVTEMSEDPMNYTGLK